MGTSSKRHRLLGLATAGLIVFFGFVAIGCSSGSKDASTTSKPKTEDATQTQGSASTVTTEEGSSDVDPALEWERIAAPRPCACSDGSDYHFWVRRADPQKVLFYLHGGGACFSRETCALDKSFKPDLSEDQSAPTGGILATENKDNPFSDYSMVVVPYCTGDLHLGNAIHDYGEGAVIRHVGAVNGMTALTTASALFPKATQVVVAGASAGSAGSPIYAGVAGDIFPKASVINIADASSAYPANPIVTKAIGSLWGITTSIPNWKDAPPADSDAWSLPGLSVQAAKHNPDIRFVRIDYADDEVQGDFNLLAGLTNEPLINVITTNQQTIRDSGANLSVWINSGTEHTALIKGFENERMGDLTLSDWLGRIVAGKPVEDQICDTCVPVAG